LIGSIRLGIGTPDAHCIFARVIIGKHKFGLIVPELSAFKLILRVPDLDAHFFQLQKAIMALPAGDVLADVAAVAVVVFVHRPGKLLPGCHGYQSVLYRYVNFRGIHIQHKEVAEYQGTALTG